MSLNHIISCYNAFDKNHDGLLDIDEFRLVCRGLFRNDRGFVYTMPEDRLREIFETFDQNNDGFIDRKEFIYCWHNWFKFIIQPRSVIIVVCIQNDFLTGLLSLVNCPSREDGVEVIEPINSVVVCSEFERVYYMMDWHPQNHISFFENIRLRPIHPSSRLTESQAQIFDTVTFAMPLPYEQTLWPKHCVENTWGAELHPSLKIVDNSEKLYNATHPDLEQTSPFGDSPSIFKSNFHSQLQKRKITDVYVCGIAYDVCVAATAMDAIALGYRTVIIEDCVRGINPDKIAMKRNQFLSCNGIITTAQQVKNLVEAKDRRPELGYMLAMNLKKKLECERLLHN